MAAAAAAPAGVARFKRFIWTGAFAAVTVVGSIYGAGLKTQQEFKAVCVQSSGYSQDKLADCDE